MPTREDRTLKLVKGAGAGAPTRAVRRRAVTRRGPRLDDPIAAILESLDDDPVEATHPADASDPVNATGPVDQPDDPKASADEGTAEGRAEGGGSGRRRRAVFARPALGRRQVFTALLVVAFCAALAAAGVFGHRWHTDRALEGAHQQALAAAKQTTVNFVSVSASSVDRDLQRIVGGATGEFKEQFTRGQSQVRAAVVENKVESDGSVLRAGLVSGDLRSAVVLVAVDATVKNVHAPQGRPSHYRIQVDVTRDPDSGKWLVSRLQFVG